MQGVISVVKGVRGKVEEVEEEERQRGGVGRSGSVRIIDKV